MSHSTATLSRRRVLCTLACTSASALVPSVKSSAAPPEAKGWTMRLSASSVAFTSLSIEQACERIAALGFEAIDIWCPFRGCIHLKDVADRLGAEGLRGLLDSHKLKLNAFSVYTTGYEPYARLLGDVGGGVAVRGSERGVQAGDDLSARMRAFFEKLKPLDALAQKHGSYVAIENHGGALLHTLDSFKAFVDLNPFKRVGLALAPYHLQSAGVPVADAISVAGDQLRFFYAWQKAAGVAQLPGHGPTDCLPWIKALAEIGYTGYVNPFMHHEPAADLMFKALAKSRIYLQECERKVIEATR